MILKSENRTPSNENKHTIWNFPETLFLLSVLHVGDSITFCFYVINLFVDSKNNINSNPLRSK